MNPDDPRSLERASTGELLRELKRYPKGPERAAIQEELQRRYDEQVPRTACNRYRTEDGTEIVGDFNVGRFNFNTL